MATPVLNTGFNPTLGSFTEGLVSVGGVAVTTLVADGSITDADGAVEAIALIGADSSLGAWQYSLDGTTWLTLRADLLNSGLNTGGQELALLLGPSARLRLLPFGDLSGSLANALEFRAWDQSQGTLANLGSYQLIATLGVTDPPYSFASDTASATLLAANDAPTFSPAQGTGSVSHGGATSTVQQVMLQPDGKILLAATRSLGDNKDFEVIRLNANGTLDTSFGSGGRMLGGLVGFGTATMGMVLQADGAIVLTGNSPDGADLGAARFTSAGALDSSFSGDGRLVQDLGRNDFDAGFRPALMADGRMVVAGYSNVDGFYFGMARLTTAGVPDTSFSGDGLATRSMFGSSFATAVLVQPDGKTVVAGFSSSSNVVPALLRLNGDGTVDATFNGDGNSDGEIYPNVPADARDNDVDAMVQQPDGKLLLAGAHHNLNGSWDLTLHRLNNDGSPDNNFDGDGFRLLAESESSAGVQRGLVVQPDGKILVSGEGRVYRLTTNGALDTSFDGDGRANVPFTATSLALQPDGKIVVAGHLAGAASVLRLHSDGSLDTSFGVVGSNTLGSSTTYVENATPVLLDGSVAVLDVELAALNNRNGNYAGATLTLARSGGAVASDVFHGSAQAAAGPLSILNGQVSLSGVLIGSLNGSPPASGAQGQLSLTFNSNATQARVNQALSNLYYSNSADAPPGTVTLIWTFGDGNAGSQGSGPELTVSESSTVNITPLNDAPVLNNALNTTVPSVSENALGNNGVSVATLVADGAISDADLSGAAPEAIAITALDTSLGEWQFSTDSGASWSDIRADLLNSSNEELALLLASTSRIRLQPFADLNGLLANAVTLRAWDQTDGVATGSYKRIGATGTSTPFSSAVETASLNVAAVNDSPTFEPALGGGTAVANFGVAAQARTLLLASDGTLTLAASHTSGFAAARFTATGQAESGFDGDGRTLVPHAGSDALQAAVLQPDGRLLMAGSAGNQFAAMRLTAGGALDNAFDGDGRATVTVGTSSVANGVALLADGRIVLAGNAVVSGQSSLAVVRLNANGTPDLNFDGDGVYTQLGGDARAVAVDAANRVITAGNSGGDWRLVRLLETGTPDATFDGDGLATVAASAGVDQVAVLRVLSDGRLLVAGTADSAAANPDFVLMRLTAAGAPDASFSGDGIERIAVGAGNSLDVLSGLAVQPDGKLVLAGSADSGNNRELAVVRLNANGGLDASFGSGGKLILARAGNDDVADVRVLPDGRIVVAGHRPAGAGSETFVIRLNADGSLDESFNGSSSNTLGGNVNYTEGAASVALDTSVAVRDVDLAFGNNGAGNYAGAMLTLRREAGAVAEDQFSARGSLSFASGVATLSGVDIGSVSNADGTLQINFNANATQARVNQALSSIGYANSSLTPPPTATLQWRFSDGNQGAQGPGIAAVASGTTTALITAVNSPPTASAQHFNIIEDEVLQSAFTAYDPEGASLSFGVLTPPAHGLLQLLPAGTGFIYTPAAEYSGSDSFVYVANDGQAASAPTTVSLSITAVNDVPRAQATTFNLSEDSTLNGQLGGSDAENTPLSFVSEQLPAHGQLQLLPNGSFSYTPAANYSGSDGFSYRVSDGQSPSEPATVTLTVQGLNDPPVALSTALGTDEDTPLVGQLQGTDLDGDTLSFVVATNPTRGQLQLQPNGGFTYTPQANFHGSDSFSFRVGDGVANSAPATFSITVTSVNDVPEVAGGTTSTDAGVLLQGQLPTASDADGDALSYALQSAAAHGVATVQADGRYSYQPAAGFAGIDSFSFLVSDGRGGVVSRSWSITVVEVAPPPQGTPNNDTLGPRSAADVYDALQGHDTVTPGLGNDTINGGDGLDWVSYAERSDAVSVNLELGRAQIGAELDVLSGLEAAIGGAGNDHFVGDAGNNIFIGNSGADTLNGGDGYDLADFRGSTIPVLADLSAGSAEVADSTDSLISIEALFGGAGNDTLRGLQGQANLRGEVLRGGPGNDTLQGGIGVDVAEFSGPIAAYALGRTSGANGSGEAAVWQLVHNAGGADGTDTLIGVERLMFTDGMRAIGTRAEELTRVAFVLWTPDIVASSALFARGLSFYDVGYDFARLCRTALNFHPLEGEAFAQQLINGARGTTRTVADVMQMMELAGGGLEGRAAAVAQMAFDPAMTQQLELMGVFSQGVRADLEVAGFGALFTYLPG